MVGLQGKPRETKFSLETPMCFGLVNADAATQHSSTGCSSSLVVRLTRVTHQKASVKAYKWQTRTDDCIERFGDIRREQIGRMLVTLF